MYYKNMYYKSFVNTKRPIIFLHGWKGSHKSFMNLIPYFKDESLYFLDLPGFGNSRITKAYTLKNYAKQINDFIVEKDLENPIIVGHSFGGRIALKLAEYKNYDTIVVSTPAFDLKSFKTKIKLVLNKCFKLKFPSKDYQNASFLERETLKQALKDTKRLRFKKMKNILIIHSKTDLTVKYKEALKLKRKVSGSALIEMGVNHFPYLEEEEKFASVVKSYASN